jgi:transposase
MIRRTSFHRSKFSFGFEERLVFELQVELTRFRGHLKIREDTMPKSYKRYPKEFKRKLIDLVREGRKPEELSRQFEPTAQSIRNWVAQADRDEGRREDGLASVEREELQRLRRENERLREEREILKKAAAWFAQESKAAPNGSSNS